MNRNSNLYIRSRYCSFLRNQQRIWTWFTQAHLHLHLHAQPYIYRRRVGHAWEQSPRNCSLEAMGDARIWETERLMVDTTLDRTELGKSRGECWGKAALSGNICSEEISPLGKVFLAIVSEGEDPHSGCFPPWWHVGRSACLLIGGYPIRSRSSRFSEHRNIQRKPMWFSHSSQCTPTFN